MKKTDNLRELVNYNLWANKRLINWLKSNNKELMTKNCQSSFSTIMDTLSHILDGQNFYYSVLNEQPFDKLSRKTFEEILSGLIEQSEAFIDYVESQKSLHEFRSIKTDNIEGTFTKSELIQHCMNHSTFHRGQIITMGHQLSFSKAPSTDMLLFYIKRNALLKVK